MLPSVFLHIATFVHIIRVTLQSEAIISHSTVPTAYATVGGDGRGGQTFLTSSITDRVSHRRHVLNSIRIQWRAAALAVIFSISVLVYWAFYLVEGSKTDLSWMSTWQLCIFTGGGDQEQCGNEFAKGNVPNFVLMMLAEFLVSTTGVWIFCLFFKQSLVMEWKEFISGWACIRRKRVGHEKDQDDQFFMF